MNYIALDIETNCLPTEDKRGNKDFSQVYAIRLGAVWCELIKLIDIQVKFGVCEYHSFDQFVRLPEGVEISPEASRVNGITAEMLAANGVQFEIAHRNLGRHLPSVGFGLLLPTEKISLVGHNLVFFDLPVWVAECDRHQLIYQRLSLLFPTVPIYDTKLIWKAWALGIKRQNFESCTMFYARVQATRGEAKTSLDFLTQTLLGRDHLREGQHHPTIDAFLSLKLFAFMSDHGIVADVLGKLPE